MGAAAPSGVGGLTHAQKRVEAFRSRLSPTAENLPAALTRA